MLKIRICTIPNIADIKEIKGYSRVTGFFFTVLNIYLLVYPILYSVFYDNSIKLYSNICYYINPYESLNVYRVKILLFFIKILARSRNLNKYSPLVSPYLEIVPT